MSKYIVSVYRSDNGYTGVMHGTGSMAVYDSKGHMVFHTRERNINTQEDLEEFIESYPEFIKKLAGWEHEEHR